MPADMPLLLEKFCIQLEVNQGLAPATASKYQGYLLRLAEYCRERNLDPLAVDQEQLEHFTGLYMHELGLSPQARKVVVSAVRKFYAWLDRAGVIDGDPARNLKQPKTGRKLGQKMDLQYMQKLIMAPGLSTFKGVRDTTIFTILAGCGPRPSGIVGLNQSDLLFSLEGEPNDQVEKLYLRFREKGKKERIVPAPDECRALLRAYLGHPYLVGIDRSLADGDQVLFIKTADTGISPADFHGEARRLSIQRINKLMLYYGKKAGIPVDQCTPKALRHLYGTELHESDVDIRLSQALMGHADIKSQTMYTHLAMRKARKAIEQANPLAKVSIPVITDLSKVR